MFLLVFFACPNIHPDHVSSFLFLSMRLSFRYDNFVNPLVVRMNYVIIPGSVALQTVL